MWKVRLVFTGGVQIHFLSSTEPREIFDSFGRRTGLDYTPVRSPDSDILGVLDWGRQDIFISCRGTVDEFPKPAKLPKARKSKSVPTGNVELQTRILDRLQLDGRKLSMNQLAEALNVPRKEVSSNVSILVRRGKAKRLGNGFNPLVSREPN